MSIFDIFLAASAGLGLGSGSLTPPPAAAASLGLFGGQRYNAPAAAAAAAAAGNAADRSAAFGMAQIYALAASRNGGSLGFGSNNNLFNNTKTRHNSIDRASNNRSLLLEDFR